MIRLDLSQTIRKIQLTGSLALHQVKEYLTVRRMAAWSLTGKMLGILITGALLPLHGMDQTSLAQMVKLSPVVEAEEGIETALVLDTASAQPIRLETTRPAFTVTVIESRSQEQSRIAREQTQRKQVTVAAAVPVTAQDVSLETKRSLAQRAAAHFGIDWKILEAVWQVESGKRWVTAVKSYAGAQGPMQFMPGTWKRYAFDGNGDGHASIYHAEDAVYAAANLLSANGAAQNVDRALLRYNNAQWYVDKVKAVAASI